MMHSPSPTFLSGCMAGSAASLSVTPNDTPYAIVNIGGAKQYVEEGMSFFVPASSAPLFDVALEGTVRFKTVLALKADGTLVRGTRKQPYLSDCQVEGELEDEFKIKGTSIKKVKVTKIVGGHQRTEAKLE